MRPEKKLIKYSKYFNERRLFKKLKSISGRLSIQLLYYILILFYLVSDKSVPYKTRIIFIAALGYLILPTDIVSDFIPGLGFTDDAAFIAYAISNASNYITPEIKEKAINLMVKFVGSENVEKINFKDIFSTNIKE
jgi:uncharacterized membrane protein YkvA (DUF1232 family)